jgi:hypothetical protein
MDTSPDGKTGFDEKDQQAGATADNYRNAAPKPCGARVHTGLLRGDFVSGPDTGLA